MFYNKQRKQAAYKSNEIEIRKTHEIIFSFLLKYDQGPKRVRLTVHVTIVAIIIFDASFRSSY